ncbi:MAG: hypothetical protein WAM86_17855, partial [Candidatus Sulfotelmatobacter sp.]
MATAASAVQAWAKPGAQRSRYPPHRLNLATGQVATAAFGCPSLGEARRLAFPLTSAPPEPATSQVATAAFGCPSLG